MESMIAARARAAMWILREKVWTFPQRFREEFCVNLVGRSQLNTLTQC